MAHIGIEENILKCIFVSRFDTDSRQRCKAEIQRRLDSDDEWPPILIFPEGDRHETSFVYDFVYLTRK